MENQPILVSKLNSQQLDSLTNNLVEAMQILFESVVKRTLQEKVTKIKNGISMKDEGEKYGKYQRI